MWQFLVLEKLVRLALLVGYLALLSRGRQTQRVFEYHDAEHKAIACWESGDTLTPDRAATYSRFHPRCGTSFLVPAFCSW